MEFMGRSLPESIVMALTREQDPRWECPCEKGILHPENSMRNYPVKSFMVLGRPEFLSLSELDDEAVGEAAEDVLACKAGDLMRQPPKRHVKEPWHWVSSLERFL